MIHAVNKQQDILCCVSKQIRYRLIDYMKFVIQVASYFACYFACYI